LMWTLIYIYSDPSLLSKIKEELLELQKQGKEIHQSEWLNMCLKESMRLTGNMSFIRGLEEDSTFEGYKMKKGNMISSSPTIIHFDEKKFPEPEKFDAERWKNDTSFSINFDNFLAFGAGNHRCKGDIYSLHVIKFVVAKMILEWDFKFTEKIENFDVNWSDHRKPVKKVFFNINKK